MYYTYRVEIARGRFMSQDKSKGRSKIERLAGANLENAVPQKKTKADEIPSPASDASQTQPPTEELPKRKGKDLGHLLGAEQGAIPSSQAEKRELSPRADAAQPKPSKLARMGVNQQATSSLESPRADQQATSSPESPRADQQATSSPESPRANQQDSPRTKIARTLGETDTEIFVDPYYTESKSIRNPAALIAGKMISSVILTGRESINSNTFKHNLSMEAGEAKHTSISLITEDGAKVSALRVDANPPSDKTIIVFQGQKGNFQDQQQLQRIFEIARETGANVLAFNYRDRPSSKQDFINDAMTAMNYVTTRMNEKADNVTFYGESFGGTVAAETAVQLKENSNKEVNVFLSRTPKSLSDAVKMIRLDALLKGPAIKILQEVTTKISESQLIKNILERGFGGDFEAQQALNKLNSDKVKCLRVEGDQIIHQDVNVEHKNMTVCTTKEADKHNASPSDLSPKWVRAKPTAVQASGKTTPERTTGFVLLRDHANPGFIKPEQPTATVAKKQ